MNVKYGGVLLSTYQDIRREKDQFFANHHHSPLTPDQRRVFVGLDYYPPNPDMRFEVPVEVFNSDESIQIPTSTGEFQTYTRYGRFYFSLEGEDAALTLYRNEHGYFLPFVDALAGIETYPAGRYLEVDQLLDGKFLVDFNQAYNPYCAYNDYWSCPLTPFENRLKVPIRAGEKIFKHENVRV